MKKFFAVLLLCVLVLTLFVSCGQKIPTRSIRWDSEQTEELVYDIRLVDDLKYIQKNSDGSLKTDENGEYVYYTADLAFLDANIDQIKPVAAIGTYTTKISSFDDDYDTVDSVLELTEVYPKSLFDNNTLDLLGTSGMIGELPENFDETHIAIKTTVAAKSVFNAKSLKPKSSEKQVKGVYVGKGRIAVNDYTVTCEYNNDVCTVKFQTRLAGEGTPEDFEKTISLGKNEYFDNETLLYLVRAYNPSEATSAIQLRLVEPLISQSVVPLYIQSQEMDIYFSETNTLSLYVYAVAPGSTAEMYIALTTKEKQTFIDQTPRIPNTILKIQQGYLVYTLCDEQMDKVLENIEQAAN